MSASLRHIVLLGPQPNYESLQRAVQRISLSGPVTVVTAGWEEDESQDSELMDSLGVPATNLELFRRSEELFSDDPVLIQQLQQRQDELRLLRDVYRMRLDYASRALTELAGMNRSGPPWEAEYESAMEHVRQLDRQYFVRTSQVCDDYDDRLQISERKHVRAHRVELAGIMGKSQALIISGGHAAIILNRLRIFGVLDMNPTIPLIAWSGGAMALADQIVVYHDWPAHGPSDPEVLRAGMGLFQDLLPLPDGRNRLDLENPQRVKAFAKRFDRYAPLVLDEGTLLERKAGRWNSDGPTIQLGQQGHLEEFLTC